MLLQWVLLLQYMKMVIGIDEKGKPKIRLLRTTNLLKKILLIQVKSYKYLYFNIYVWLLDFDIKIL